MIVLPDERAWTLAKSPLEPRAVPALMLPLQLRAAQRIKKEVTLFLLGQYSEMESERCLKIF
jgi:hypothetical protein